MIQGKIALNLWCIRHNAVQVLTNQSTGSFVFHLAPLPLVSELGDQAIVVSVGNSGKDLAVTLFYRFERHIF